LIINKRCLGILGLRLEEFRFQISYMNLGT